MATTYIDIVNIALREINEVPLQTSAFNAPRGLQAAAKEMVNRAYADVLNHSKEWPFLNEKTPASLSVSTVALQQEYTVTTAIDHIDWDSFFIIDDNNDYKSSLEVVDIDFYTQHLKQRDTELTDGGDPMFVYRLKSNDGFGLSPLPSDKGYTVSYAAWTKPTLLVNSTDEIAFPERYYNVIVSRARYYLWLFRENAQQAQLAARDYDDSIKKMHRDLVDKQAIKMTTR
jgi:hypothetical protein